MVGKSPLDDPENALHAWQRYKRIMRFMFMLSVGLVLIAFALMYKFAGEVSIHFYIATAIGISFSMLLAGALMGLIFMSNGTGHDESINNNLPGHDED